jgi:electron transport complex protein RnfB
MSGSTLLPALGAATGLAVTLGAALGWIASRLRSDPGSLAGRIDALLPQTQCGQCLYPGCRPYAQAIAAGEADIDRCPPGGDSTVRALAALLGRDPRPVDPRYGATGPPRVAVIDESRCIGCALCLPACPVDAIVGAPRYVHTVIAAQCTGCELCLPPCPVDCIAMADVDGAAAAGPQGRADA